MLVVDCQLWSAVTAQVSSLGLVVIDLQDTKNGGRQGSYRVRAYRKGQTVADIAKGAKPIREGFVKSYNRHADPVWKLVALALDSIGHSA